MLFVQLKTHSKKIIIGLIYRPLVHNIISDRKVWYQIFKVSSSFESVIFGDFNLFITSWENVLKISYELRLT